MKRFLPVFVLFLVLFSGYVFYTQRGNLSTSTPNPAQEEEEIKDVREVGIISSLGNITVPGSGTHLLTKIDKTTILLTGLGANLDEYLQKNVEIEGRLSQSPSGKQLIQVLRVTPIETTSTTTIDPKEAQKWETFKDESFGMTFQQRHGWDIAKTTNTVTFTIPSLSALSCGDQPICPAVPSSIIKIERVLNSDNASLSSFTGDAKTSTKNLIGPHKLVGYKRTQADKGIITFVVAREKYVFVLTYTPGNFKTYDPSTNDFFSLIASFDFIPVKK